MNSRYDFNKSDEGRLVYVRTVDVTDLPLDVQDQVDDCDTLYAVHRADGERLALVKERALAFELARQNDYSPVTVH
ncbi:MAG: DUF1150 domain-containing protein [Pelagimonas sp.]|jgi:hypothetical protein|nr:DUF1150 domain-containing protein [Pelagimonas sp.]